MLFLLQNKITKNEKSEYFDENLFRSYFKKLYKSLFRMEGEFMSILDQEARKGFMQFTKSLKDLATEFKCFREHSELDEYTEIRPTRKQVKEVTSKMVFGQVAKRPASSCRIVPAMMGGFFTARLEPRKKRAAGEDSDQDQAKEADTQAESTANITKELNDTVTSLFGGNIGKATGSLMTASRKRNKAKIKSVPGDMPDDFKGVEVKQPDYNMQNPSDFLLIGRIQKRNTRPLTVSEVEHRERLSTVQKLE